MFVMAKRFRNIKLQKEGNIMYVGLFTSGETGRESAPNPRHPFLKFREGRKIGEKNQENERKIKKSSNILHRQKTNIWTKTDEFLGGNPLKGRDSVFLHRQKTNIWTKTDEFRGGNPLKGRDTILFL